MAMNEAVRDEFASRRLRREWRTIEAMIVCYCRDHHETGAQLCPECQGLLEYAGVRRSRCRFGEEKPTCARCPVHCYQRERREQVKAVMRYAGPRMLWQHPLLSLGHWLDSWRKPSQAVRSAAREKSAPHDNPVPGTCGLHTQ
jgi:hypothetical protein